MTCSIQLDNDQDIGQGIVVGVHIKGQLIEVFVKFLDYSQFEGEKLQFMGRVVRFSLSQTPNGIGNDGIYTIIMSLVEHSPQARPTSISMEFKWTGEICIGENRCCGAQML